MTFCVCVRACLSVRLCVFLCVCVCVSYLNFCCVCECELLYRLGIGYASSRVLYSTALQAYWVQIQKLHRTRNYTEPENTQNQHFGTGTKLRFAAKVALVKKCCNVGMLSNIMTRIDLTYQITTYKVQNTKKQTKSNQYFPQPAALKIDEKIDASE